MDAQDLDYGMTASFPGRRGELEALLFHPADLTSLELRVWHFVRSNPRSGTLEIAEGLHVNRKSVGRAAKRLLRFGLVQEYPQRPLRSRDAAGRLTPTGYLALEPS